MALRNTHKTILRIGVSVTVALALSISYVLADLSGVLPASMHVLQWQSARRITLDPARQIMHTDALITPNTHVALDATSAQQLVDALVSSQGVGRELSIAVADDQGHIVAEHDVDTAREPASTAKTLTAFAASQALDMSDTLDTTLWLEGGASSPQHIAQPAHIVLTGQGDMLLGAGQSDPNHINGRAGIATLVDQAVQQLQQLGISQIQLQYDDSLFGAQRLPQGITSMEGGLLYAAPLSSMAIDEGRNWQGLAKPDNPDEVGAYAPSTANSALSVAQAVANQFAAAGIAVVDTVQSTSQPFDANASVASALSVVHSASLQEILQFTLQNSDNTLAQLFARLTALATHSGNSIASDIAAVTAQLHQAGVNTQGLHLADCSGLSAGSTLTARTLIDVEQRSTQTGPAQVVARSLAVSGLSGTALHRSFSSSVAGQIHLKTGTLGNVTSMTGNVLRTHGGTLTFAVLVNNPENMWEAMQAVDTFVSALVQL